MLVGSRVVAVGIVSSSLFPATINNNLTQNALNTQRNNTNSDHGDIKIDWNPTDKDHVSGRFTRALTLNPVTNTQSQNLEFRAEAINFTNTPILAGPGDSENSVTLGRITNSQGARNMQFGMKYNF